jgi:DNA polymerase I
MDGKQAVKGMEPEPPAKDKECNGTGPEIAINQVEYSNTPGGPVIHIFGRDREGNAHHIQVTDFRPYFYIPLAQADSMRHPAQVEVETGKEYLSIRGDRLRRLYTGRPTDVREVRDRYHHFEADIPFATRFMIDTGLTGGVKAPGSIAGYGELVPSTVNYPARVCMIDIECEDHRGFPEPERDAIICITSHDSFCDDYTSFIYSPGEHCDLSVLSGAAPKKNGCFLPGTHTIHTYSTEQEMMKGFTEYIRTRDPDIISGWNLTDFDLPYITRRMVQIGLSPIRLSRLEGQTERNALRGRGLFDLLQEDARLAA